MGGSRGQSTATLDKWPLFIEAANPSMREAYIFSMRDAGQKHDGILDNFLTGYRVLTLNSEEGGSLITLANRGKTGNTTITKGRKLIKEVIDGDYLNGTEARFVSVNSNANTKSKDAFTNDIEPKIGGSLYVIGDPNPSPTNIAKSLVSGSSAKYRSRMDAEMFYKNYSYERREQIQALGHALEYSDQEMVDAEMVRRAGLYGRENKQQRLEDLFDRNLDYDMSLVKNMETIGNAVRIMVGTYEAKTQPYYRPGRGGAILGGAMTGFSLGGPWGALAGGILGGIAGG